MVAIPIRQAKTSPSIILGLIIVVVGILLLIYPKIEIKPTPQPTPPLPLPTPDPPTPEPTPQIGKLIEVTTETQFRQAVKDNPNRAVLISGEWCPYCVKLERSGEIERIRKAIPHYTIIKADLNSRALQNVYQIFQREERNGTLKKFSANSTVRAFPSFVIKNNVFTGGEIKATNITRVLEK